mmetsp:Transcript_2507/g.6304  ORF Transcript_2507/g.6304 Transcript_2507/m.6304 type:complete len:311 (-) Transcript_2507:133-1065(-)
MGSGAHEGRLNLQEPVLALSQVAVGTTMLHPRDGLRMNSPSKHGGNTRASSSSGEDEEVQHKELRWAKLLDRERHDFVALSSLHSDLAKELLVRLESVQAKEFDVTHANVARVKGKSGVGYQEVYSSPEMTLCIFLLRAGARIPMHDHPDMHVFCRVLFGRLRVTSWDLDDKSDRVTNMEHANQEEMDLASLAPTKLAYPELAQQVEWADKRRQPRWATLYSSEVYGPKPQTYALGPGEGNIHEIEALEDCAFFDVVLPPYSPATGRDCTYYRRVWEDGSGRCMVVPCTPIGFTTEAQVYKGPPIFAKAE